VVSYHSKPSSASSLFCLSVDIFPPKFESQPPEPRRRKRAPAPSSTANGIAKKPRPSSTQSTSKNPYRTFPPLLQRSKQAKLRSFWHTKEDLETFLQENRPVAIEAGPSTNTSSLPAPFGSLSVPTNDVQTHIEDPHSINISLSSYWPSSAGQPEFCLQITNQGIFRAYGFFGWRKRRRKREPAIPQVHGSEVNGSVTHDVGVDEERAMVGIRFTFLAENETVSSSSTFLLLQVYLFPA
jgi:hypothetical protein